MPETGTESAKLHYPSAAPRRRYDIDWLRALALLLLIVYHAAISFQPWGKQLYFPVTQKPAPHVWTVMRLFNIWRIPLLYFVAGMGTFFSLRRRTWSQLLGERAVRLLLPLGFGAFVIVPGMLVASMLYYRMELSYVPDLGHLWFLLNIFAYTVVLLGVLLYVARHPQNRLTNGLRKLLTTPFGLIPLAVPFWIEAVIINPQEFTIYFAGTHAFLYGLLAFFTGFMLATVGDEFKRASMAARYPALGIAGALYICRITIWGGWHNPLSNFLTMTEALCWIATCFGFAAVYLSRPSAPLRMASRLVFPVYVLHLPVQGWLSLWLLPVDLPNAIKYPLLVIATLAVSTLLAVAISYVKPLRPLFGMRYNKPRIKRKRIESTSG